MSISKRLEITIIKSIESFGKFSEAVIHKPIRRAKKEKVSEIYFSVIPNNKDKSKLMEIFASFGFKKVGIIKRIFLFKEISESNYDCRNSYSKLTQIKNGRLVQIIVLDDKYHDNYIQDAKLGKKKQNQDFDKITIQKAYLHKQKEFLKLKKSDLIYRQSSDNLKTYNSCITGYGGIIKSYRKGKDYNNFG